MVAKYQIGFFSKTGADFPREGRFSQERKIWFEVKLLAFWVIVFFMPQSMEIQLTPSYQAHPLASAPPHVVFFYLREQVLFISIG